MPLDAVARFTEELGPLTVNHAGQLPAVTIFVQPAAGRVIERGGRPDRTPLARTELPGTITTSFQGTAQAFESSLSGLWILLVAAIVVIYIVLGILYESFVHPLTILSGLPSAGFGALLALMAVPAASSTSTRFVGLIMLIGIVKKNAIMQIDFALEAQRNGGQGAARRDLRRAAWSVSARS